MQMARVMEDFQKLAPATVKASLPTVERFNGGTASWLVKADQSLCRDGTLLQRCKFYRRLVVIGFCCTVMNSASLYFGIVIINII